MADETEPITRPVEETPVAEETSKVPTPKSASPGPAEAPPATTGSAEDVTMSSVEHGETITDTAATNGEKDVTQETSDRMDDEGGPEPVEEETEPEPAPAPAPASATTTSDAEPSSAIESSAPVDPSHPAESSLSRSKSKSTSKKLATKKSMPKLKNMDGPQLYPGMTVLATMKGFPPWPSMIVPDEVLPEAVLKMKPKESTSRRKSGINLAALDEDQIPPGARGSASGSWPVMFLNNFDEFQWIAYTEIKPLDMATINAWNAKGKGTLALKDAYARAAEGHTLDSILDLKAEQYIDEPEPEAVVEEPEPMDVDEDEEADDVDDDGEEKTKKKSHKKGAAATVKKAAATAGKSKRKAEEEPEPAKTPKRQDSGKTKIPANGTSKSHKKKVPAATEGDVETTTQTASKSHKKKLPATTAAVSASSTPVPPSRKSAAPKAKSGSPPVRAPTYAEDKDRRSKEVLYCRHRLQKSLLTTNKTPVTEDIASINKYFQTLESYPNLEVSIIRSTKINKVLKAIMKLQSIPNETEYHFKPRAQSLLEQWNKLLASEPEPAAAAATNGGSGGEKKEKEASEEEEAKVEVSGVDEVEKSPVEAKDEVMTETPVVEEKKESTPDPSDAHAAEVTEAKVVEPATEEKTDAMEVDSEEKPAVAAAIEA